MSKINKINSLEKSAKYYNAEEAAGYLGVTEVELESYTRLGWVKYKTYNGKIVYCVNHLNVFATKILIPLEEKMGL